MSKPTNMSELPKISELLKQPEKMRAMCAEACGLNPRVVRAPDYGNDLNACAEMEKTMTEVEYVRYHIFLERAVSQIQRGENAWAKMDWNKWNRDLQSATAAQRLDAFLLAKGLAQP